MNAKKESNASTTRYDVTTLEKCVGWEWNQVESETSEDVEESRICLNYLSSTRSEPEKNFEDFLDRLGAIKEFANALAFVVCLWVLMWLMYFAFGPIN